MKPTVRNIVRLWWHCLIHLHRECYLYSIFDKISETELKFPSDELKSIRCGDCEYGFGD
jgi:hypothetical protein